MLQVWFGEAGARQSFVAGILVLLAKAMKLLEHDPQNGPYHCFGYHERCSPDLCLSARERVESSRDTSGNGAASDEDTAGA